MIEDEINELISERVRDVGQTYPKVRQAFKIPYNWPEIDILRYEACVCIIFSLNQAAITITNHMLESFLKYAISYKQSIENDEFKKADDISRLTEALIPAFEENDSKDLRYTINKSCSLGIITKEQEKMLHKYRVSMRNAYGHAEKQKIHEDREIPIQLASVNEKTGIQIKEERTTKILHMPFMHDMAQIYHAKANSIPYFLYIDLLVRESMPKVFPSSVSKA